MFKPFSEVPVNGRFIRVVGGKVDTNAVCVKLGETLYKGIYSASHVELKVRGKAKQAEALSFSVQQLEL